MLHRNKKKKKKQHQTKNLGTNFKDKEATSQYSVQHDQREPHTNKTVNPPTNIKATTT